MAQSPQLLKMQSLSCYQGGFSTLLVKSVKPSFTNFQFQEKVISAGIVAHSPKALRALASIIALVSFSHVDESRANVVMEYIMGRNVNNNQSYLNTCVKRKHMLPRCPRTHLGKPISIVKICGGILISHRCKSRYITCQAFGNLASPTFQPTAFTMNLTAQTCRTTCSFQNLL